MGDLEPWLGCLAGTLPGDAGRQASRHWICRDMGRLLRIRTYLVPNYQGEFFGFFFLF